MPEGRARAKLRGGSERGRLGTTKKSQRPATVEQGGANEIKKVASFVGCASSLDLTECGWELLGGFCAEV